MSHGTTSRAKANGSDSIEFGNKFMCVKKQEHCALSNERKEDWIHSNDSRSHWRARDATEPSRPDGECRPSSRLAHSSGIPDRTHLGHARSDPRAYTP